MMPPECIYNIVIIYMSPCEEPRLISPTINIHYSTLAPNRILVLYKVESNDERSTKELSNE